MDKLALDANAVVLVHKEAKLLCVRNLSDRKAGAVHITAGRRDIPIFMGQEAVFTLGKRASDRGSSVPARIDCVGLRRTRMVNLPDGNKLSSSEVSLIGILSKDPLMTAIRKSSNPEDKELFNKSMKSAVVLNYATGSHGAYSQE
jgi:hypothetical protein